MTPSPPREAAVPDALSDLPEGWSVVRTWGPPGFTTHARLRRPDGSEVEWSSRRHRKGLGLRSLEHRRSPGTTPSRWRGRASPTSWWLGGLFGVGSVCFALGSLPLYFDRVAPAAVAATFFAGSIFFTSAGYLTYRETVAAPEGILDDSRRPRGLRALIGWTPRRIDWWAATIQLVGTVAFNVTTFAATRTDLSLQDERRLVWGPDVIGSVCFLVASGLAYAEVNRGVLPRSDRSVGWRIAALNLVGSLAFGASAVGARYLTTTGEVANIALVNAGTFLGAVCFLLGAALLPVESAQEATAP